MKPTRQYQSTLRRLTALLAAGLAASLLISLGSLAIAQPPQAFHISYDATYGNLSAEAERSLSSTEDNGQLRYQMQAVSKATLLGRSLVTITEQSHFGWQEELPVPERYRFRQSGLGKRQRSIEFKPDAALISFDNDGNSGELSVSTPVYDDLNAFLVIRQQLLAGASDIYFDVLNKDSIKNYHYQVIDQNPLQTAAGVFAAVHLERIRGGDSERSTELWLAPEHDYLLLKMRQEEPSGRIIRLDINTATVAGKAL